MKRLRLVQMVVQAVLVVDDGETLEPVQVAPITVKGGQLDSFPEQMRAEMTRLEAELNGDAPDTAVRQED